MLYWRNEFTILFANVQSKQVINNYETPGKIRTTLILLTMCLLVACGPSQNSQQSANQGKHLIKSAHYFSSAWPKTFWQEFQQSDVAAELSQIKADGFNTIVLTVPWRGFELGFENNQTSSNPLLYQRLEQMLKNISEQGPMFWHFHR